MKPASISAKGRTGEHEVAAMIGGKRNVLSGAVGGNDVIDARPPYDGLAIEVKRRAKLPAIATEPLAQAAYAARGGGRLPAVFYREDGGQWIVAMYAGDFITWVDGVHQVGRASRVHAIGRELETLGHELQGGAVSTYRIIEGDAADVLRTLDAASVQTVITSPPYWGLRDYGTGTWEGGNEGCDHERQSATSRLSSTLVGSTTTQGGTYAWGATCGKCGAHRIDSQLGLEPTPEEYVERLVSIFREVRRVLRDDGTVWLNLGDNYNGVGRGEKANGIQVAARATTQTTVPGLKPKDLVGIPWRVAFALQADGWYLRSDIIWSKPNPMPESVTDRPTKAHEYLFLLARSARYYFDADAVREPMTYADGFPVSRMYQDPGAREGQTGLARNGSGQSGIKDMTPNPAGRNIRSVWNIATHPYPGAHFATFPPRLVEPCVKAGSAIGDTVLDPFAGAGTCGMVALRHGRDFIGIELNPTYAEMARNRVWDDGPLFNVEV